jgi:hypothetical protein
LRISFFSLQLPTTFDPPRATDNRPTSSFKNSGRLALFIENSTTYYRSHREDVARSNLGPGSYNIAYKWRTDDINFPHLRAVKSAPEGTSQSAITATQSTVPMSPSRICCINKARPTSGEAYERPWRVHREPKQILSPRGQQIEKEHVQEDIATVRNLPNY